MNLYNKARLILSFYKDIAFASLITTAACVELYWKWGKSILDTVIVLKLALLVMMVVFTNSYRNREFYYYGNLGLTKWTLWSAVVVLDLTLFFVLLLQPYKF